MKKNHPSKEEFSYYGDSFDTLLAFDIIVALKSIHASVMDDASIDNEGRAELIYANKPFVISSSLIRLVARYDENTGKWPTITN